MSMGAPDAAYWAAAQAYVDLNVPIRARRSSRLYRVAVEEVTQMVAGSPWLRALVDAAWKVACHEMAIPDRSD